MTRLSPAVKRRLQSSLENLTPREAGRLYAIYALEADKKGLSVIEYPPAIELQTSFGNRVNKARGKPNEAEAVALSNGLIYLQNIFAATNEVFSHMVIATGFDNFKAMSGLLFLLHQDAMTEAIRGLKGRLIDEFPRPVEVEDYDRLLEWAKTDALIALRDAAEHIFLSVESQEFIDSLSDREDLVARVASGEAKDLVGAFGDYVYDQMIAKLQAGELVGGEGFWTNEIDYPVLIVEGYIPAWAALRVAWRPYVRSRDLQIYDSRDWENWSPNMVDQVGSNGEGLTQEGLRRLATDFYKDCRRRPWGKGLVAKPDLDDLVKLLTQSANPFLHLKPYDFGRVNWEAFSQNEVDWRGKPIESELVATAASLNALPDALRQGEDLAGIDYLRSRYYPTTGASFRRMEIQRSMAMFDRLETTRQPFTFDRKEDGELSLSEFMGIKFMTPFEEGVERLRRSKASTMAIDVALATISDRYFGGLPILLKDVIEYMEMGRDYIASAEDLLSSWLKELSVWPWKIDVSNFRLDDVEADQDLVDKLIDQVVAEARRGGRFTESEEELIGKE